MVIFSCLGLSNDQALFTKNAAWKEGGKAQIRPGEEQGRLRTRRDGRGGQSRCEECWRAKQSSWIQTASEIQGSTFLFRKPHSLAAERRSKLTCHKGDERKMWQLYILYEGTLHKSTIGSLKPVSQRPVPLPQLKGDVKGLWPLPFMCIDPSGGGGASSSKPFTVSCYILVSPAGSGTCISCWFILCSSFVAFSSCTINLIQISMFKTSFVATL